MYEPHFITIHPKVVAMFLSGPKWWTGWLTAASMAKYGLLVLVCVWSPWTEQRVVFLQGNEGSASRQLCSAASALRSDPDCWAPVTNWTPNTHNSSPVSFLHITPSRWNFIFINIRNYRWPLRRSEVTEVQVMLQWWAGGKAARQKRLSEVIWWIILPNAFRWCNFVIFHNTGPIHNKNELERGFQSGLDGAFMCNTV